MAILRSIAAVLAGMIFIIGASTGTDLALQHTVLPTMNTAETSPPLLTLALAYRAVFGVIGGWIAARLAPGRPMTHALVLGVIGAIAAAAGVVAAWSLGDHWYPIALCVLSIPETWLGGRLAERRSLNAT
jgi:uncharacterized membrane protein YeaQ/YmgE (transglycosylase-associated protein family)